MGNPLEVIERSIRDAPVVDRDGYEYFVHGITDGIPRVEPSVVRAIAAGIADEVDLEAVDYLVAPEAMGIHHATALSLETDVPFVVVRKRSYGFPDEVAVHQETAYGESDLHVNGLEADDRVVLVDDVLSSGSTIRAVCAGLEEIGVDLVDVIVVLRRVDTDHGELPVDVRSLLDVRVEDGRVVVL
ncbi:hypoxanthine/guanine phosphoribosyltransferase [Natrialbaceae archaeon GCM10025810]|uniref:hypoxanthine/guanine phosphoribosyltransferase n=1 Tax=Halovalidus salilacus TaxID=3075124 RepID=UPI003615A290